MAQRNAPLPIAVPAQAIEAFCRKWQVREFALFGSVLRSDFHADSDVDVLVSFDGIPDFGLWALSDMAEELTLLFGRKVDLAVKEGLRNPYRREAILRECEVLYAA